LQENGPDWLGEGLLFLSNRWEASNFLKIMQAQGWPADYYATYTEGEAGEHFAEFAYDVWEYAPCPRPGNFFSYLPGWAEAEGLIPSDNVQVFTGLWANEAWHAFLQKPNHWLRRVRKSYGCHMIASMPIKAQWEEYPLVPLSVLNILRQTTENHRNANILRKQVGIFACPEASGIKRINASDGSHALSERLQHELDNHYKQTEFGKRKEWEVPENSGNSTHWGQWSSALLIDKLISEGKTCTWL